MPGLGKASLLRNLANHISERSLYPEGILYLNLNKVTSIEQALHMISSHLSSIETKPCYLAKKTLSKSSDEYVSHLNFVLSSFKKKFLLILNNVNFIA